MSKKELKELLIQAGQKKANEKAVESVGEDNFKRYTDMVKNMMMVNEKVAGDENTTSI